MQHGQDATHNGEERKREAQLFRLPVRETGAEKIVRMSCLVARIPQNKRTREILALKHSLAYDEVRILLY